MKKSKIKRYVLILVCITFTYCTYFAYAQQDSFLGKDSDNDGLTDAEESIYKTDSHNPDTDGDGYSDGVEVKSGYDPLKPAPGDRFTASKNSTPNLDAQNNQTLTEKFAQTTKGFLATKDGQTISPTELDSFLSNNFSSQIKEYPSFDNLPEIDIARIKIKQQDYKNLSEEKQRERESDDTKEYLTKLLTLFYSNLPEGALSNNDITTLYDNIQKRFVSFSTSSPDYAFFRDFADKMSLAIDQSYEIEVPQQLLEDHIKTLRIAKGYLQLKEDDSINSIDDPLSQMIILTRARNMMNFSENFLTEEIKKLSTIIRPPQ